MITRARATTPTLLTAGTGYTGSESYYAAWGRQGVKASRPILYLQGSHSLAFALSVGSDWDRTKVLATHGCSLIAGDLGQTTSQGTFGSDLVQTRTGQLKTFHQGTLNAASGKVGLLAGSGGVTAALNYARANPSNVSCIVGMAPLVDLQDFYENRTDGSITQAEIRTAYGGSIPTYSTHNPSATGNQSALSGIPIQLWYSTDDPYIPVSTVTGFQTKVQAAGGTCEVKSMGAVGHAAPTSACNPYEILDFFLRYP